MIYLPNGENFNLCFILKRSATNPIFFKCYDYHFSVIDEESLVHIFSSWWPGLYFYIAIK